MLRSFGPDRAAGRTGPPHHAAGETAALDHDDRDFLAQQEAEIGNSVLAAESVSCAVAILAYGKAKVWTRLRLAASIGNDSDSVATSDHIVHTFSFRK